jgi:hypothetical protein
LSGGATSPDVKGLRIPVTKQIALKDVRPGRYVLRVEARLLGNDANRVSRETAVTVVP